ncbi:ABC transporter ATP-binding protein [Camelimonas abortus]|uniref:ABC transporter ATP-binding protein n=1 Tax=Camelimonas abortus TaxID=1017184 RepID=A0ABV7LAS5_9HYPH
MSAPLLEVRDLRKRFGGLVAVKDVSFTVGSGEIVGILGPNGAGKTTLFNLITGFIPPDSGEVIFDGRSIRGLAPWRVVNHGLARTFQLTRPFLGMTVVENLLVASQAPRVRHHAHGEARALEILELVGLRDKAYGPVEILPYGDLRRLEIARALATQPRLLLLDEPFAGLGSSEIAPLSELIRRLHDEEGLTILIIEHKLREFMALTSRVIALDFGEVIGVGAPSDIVRNPRVVEAYIGRKEDAGDAA